MAIQIRPEQMKAFEAVVLRNLEDRLADYLEEFFPERSHNLDDEQVRGVIQYGMVRARHWQISSERGVHLYLATMLILGSDFDTDPQYPWAASILSDPTMEEPDERIFHLSDEVLAYWQRVAGNEEEHWHQALATFCALAQSRSWRAVGTHLDGDVGTWLREIWPTKYAGMAEDLVCRVIQQGRQSAHELGLTGSKASTLYIGAMFLLGQNWLQAPQFPWGQSFRGDDPIDNRSRRLESLFEVVTEHLQGMMNLAVEDGV
jgi:hypothetical protein